VYGWYWRRINFFLLYYTNILSNVYLINENRTALHIVIDYISINYLLFSLQSCFITEAVTSVYARVILSTKIFFIWMDFFILHKILLWNHTWKSLINFLNSWSILIGFFLWSYFDLISFCLITLISYFCESNFKAQN